MPGWYRAHADPAMATDRTRPRAAAVGNLDMVWTHHAGMTTPTAGSGVLDCGETTGRSRTSERR